MNEKDIKKILEANIFYHCEEYGDSGQVQVMDFNLDNAAHQIAQLDQPKLDNIDKEILDLVKALNLGGIPTVGSCSGHSKEHGYILLQDERTLIILPAPLDKDYVTNELQFNQSIKLKQRVQKDQPKGDSEGLLTDEEIDKIMNRCWKNGIANEYREIAKDQSDLTISIKAAENKGKIREIACDCCPDCRATIYSKHLGVMRAERLDRPKIICLCGSSRFIESFAVLAWEFEKLGAITLGLHYLPPSYCREHIPDHLAEHEGVAKRMDELHLRKIDIADEVFVINLDGYVGESTSNEIAYAKALGKPIKYLEETNG